MKNFDWEDWAVMGSLFFFSMVVLLILGIWKEVLVYWWIGARLLSMASFGIALYVKNKL